MSESHNTSSKRPPVVYACSGYSDAGELADRIARRLTREGAAEMSCLAGIGGRVKPLVNKAASAERILAIDGCPLNCTRHTLELAGFKNFDHLELHALGFKKNSAPVTEERITVGVDAAKKILSAEHLDKSPNPLIPSFSHTGEEGARRADAGATDDNRKYSDFQNQPAPK